MTVLIDSNGWFQYFLGSKKAAEIRRIIENSNEKIVLSLINFIEIYSTYLRDSPNEAEEKLVFIRNRSELKDINYIVASLAVKLKGEHKLSTTDSIVLATAKLNNAQLLTSDKDFKGIQGVRFF